jgi:hypothetical protein
MIPEAFVDADVVAIHLRITRRQVLEMTRRNAIPGYPLGTGSTRKVWRYKLSEIDATVTGVGRKKAPDAAFGQNAISGTIGDGSPRSQKGKSDG